MPTISYSWNDDDAERTLDFVYVEGTAGQPYRFGEGGAFRDLDVGNFYIATTPVTQAFWTHVMGGPSPSVNQTPTLPVENVSWNDITQPGGFLERLRECPAGKRLLVEASIPSGTFRLPSEAEWEYAARGGPHWRDGFPYSGGTDIDAVAWYGRRDGHTHPIAEKAPNQLGLYDMSGNVWEWCQDAYNADVSRIPADGRPHLGDNPPERVLRGGCFHNWAVHCTVSKRYQIERQFHDGCIGFRLVMAEA